MSALLFLVASLQTAPAYETDPAAKLPSVLGDETCFNDWSAATDYSTMDDQQIVTLFRQKCVLYRAPAMLAIAGPTVTPERGNDAVKRLAALEESWVARYRAILERKKVGKK